MANRREKGFFDEEFRLRKISKHGDPLERLDKAINWKIFRPILNKTFKKEPKGPGGRPPYDYVMMFKVLILQRYYKLSDDKIEYQINDRLSFQRFLGIRLADEVPDQTTVWLFKETLNRYGAVKKLFKRFERHLKESGLLVNRGSIVDASFVDVPRQRNSREENEAIKGGKIPAGWKDKGNKMRQKDIDARWTEKNREKHYGYKNHIKAEKKTKFIQEYAVTAANVHDSQAVGELLDKGDRGKALWGDSAYSGGPIEKQLNRRDMINKIHEKGYRNKPLTDRQKEKNHKKSKIRVRVEHIFGFIENSMGGSFIRSIGLCRAGGTIGLMNLTYNIFRCEQLVRLRA